MCLGSTLAKSKNFLAKRGEVFIDDLFRYLSAALLRSSRSTFSWIFFSRIIVSHINLFTKRFRNFFHDVRYKFTQKRDFWIRYFLSVSKRNLKLSLKVFKKTFRCIVVMRTLLKPNEIQKVLKVSMHLLFRSKLRCLLLQSAVVATRIPVMPMCKQDLP